MVRADPEDTGQGSPRVANVQPSLAGESAAADDMQVRWYAALLEQAREALFVWELDGGITYWNQGATRLYGYTRAQVLGQRSHVLLRTELVDQETLHSPFALDAYLEREGEWEGELRHTTATGTPLIVHAVMQVVTDARGRRFVLESTRDMTERYAAEAALAASEERFHTLAEHIPQLAWMAHPDGHIFWYNHHWYAYTGMTPESQEGWGWEQVHDPTVLPQVLERWRHSLATGAPFEMVFPLRGADGTYRPFLTRIAPVKDARGQVQGWFGTNTDITEQQATEDALRRANEAKDEFLSIVAHELRTPLTALKARSQILQRRVQLGGKVDPRHLDTQERAINRMVRLVEDLLETVRAETGRLQLEYAPADLVALCTQVADEQRSASGRVITLEVPAAPLMVTMDSRRIEQVVTNLLSNALKYSPATAAVTLSVLRERESARVRVRDTGPGIPAEALPHLFELYYRAPEAQVLYGSGIGLGVGLYLSKQIVEAHGGTITVESVLGTGTTCTVSLPLHGKTTAQSARAE